MPRKTTADLERWAVDQVLRHITGAHVAAKVGEVYAYPGARTPWEAFKATSGVGGTSSNGRYTHWGAGGITATDGGEQVEVSWRKACSIALREGLILRALAEAYPDYRFVFAKNEEAKERVVVARRASTKPDNYVDLGEVRTWEDTDGQVQRRDGQGTHQGGPGRRSEMPVVRE